jgi:hypothetical protein
MFGRQIRLDARRRSSQHPVVTTPAPPPTPFDLALHGALNGAAVALEVQGVILPGELRFEARPAASEPLVGDLTILALAAVDVPLLVACRAARLEEDGPRCSWVDAAVRGEGGVLVGRLELAVDAEFAGGKLGVRAQLIRGEVALEPGERVTRVEERAALSVVGVEGVRVATRVFAVETGRGRRLTVTCVGWEAAVELSGTPAIAAELEVEHEVARRVAQSSPATLSHRCRVKVETGRPL